MAYSISAPVLKAVATDVVWSMGAERMAKFCYHWGVDRNDVHLRASAWLFTARNGFFESRCHFCPRVANAVPFEIRQLIFQRAVDCVLVNSVLAVEFQPR